MADRNIPNVEAMYSPVGDVVLVDGHSIRHDLVRESDALLVRSVTKVDRALLEKSNIRFVGTATIGTDHIDLDYLRERNIAFASAPGSNAQSVAEYVLAALLTISERKNIAIDTLSIGIIGVGHVGTKVEHLANILKMKSVLNDPPLKRVTGDQDRYRNLDEVLEADIITLHVPLTLSGPDATYHLVDEQFLEKIKPGTIMINASRGAVIDTEVLRDFLARKRVGSCVLDVWENEPSIDCDLLRLVDIGTPHIAGYSYDGKMNGAEMIYKSFCESFAIDGAAGYNSCFEKLEDSLIALGHPASGLQTSLRAIVKHCYNIERDDSELREMLRLDPEARSAHFRSLRKNYPRRYEFKNWAVANTGYAGFDYILQQLGFTVRVAAE